MSCLNNNYILSVLYRTENEILHEPIDLLPDNTHFLMRIPHSEGKRVRRRCHGCYKKISFERGPDIAARRTKQVATACILCRKPYCMICFADYHQLNEYMKLAE